MEQVAAVLDWGLSASKGELPLISRVVYLLIPTLGDAHKRQRRAKTPAFGLVEAKALYPYFARCSNSVSNRPIHGRSLMSKPNFLSSDSSRTNCTR